jgi:hypothetical protein
MTPRRAELIRLTSVLKPCVEIMYFPLINETSQQKSTNLEEGYFKVYQLFIIESKEGEFVKIPIETLLYQVRCEIDLNLSLPIEPHEKQKYLQEVLKLYSEIDDKIIEDDNGILSFDSFRFIKYSNQSEVYFDDLERFLSELKNKIRKEIKFLTKRMNKLSDKILKSKDAQKLTEFDTEKSKKKARIFPKHSFELNPKLYNSDSNITDKLKDFKESLYKGGYIKQIDLRDFIHIFRNQIVTNPVQWVADPKELYYLIKSLHDQALIVQFKNYWFITCKCFIAYHKNNILCTPQYLQRCKPSIHGDKLRKLKSVIAALN